MKQMRVISEEEIRAVVREPEALHAADAAFRALGSGRAIVPPPLSLSIDPRSELHVKCAYLRGSPVFVVKAATGFYDNPQRGLPSGSGVLLAFDAASGFPRALLADNGYLTELRTAGAAALAARLLAPPTFERLAIVGAGTQARYQLRAFAHAFHWTSTMIWARDAGRAEQLCQEMRNAIMHDVRVATTIEAAIRDADIVITVTPSTQPLVRGEWLQPHATVIAVGADSPEKRELDERAFKRAGKIVVDSVEQCARLGELHHAIESGVVTAARVDAELGEIVVGAKPGRAGQELIICDLTGLGAQDAALAELVLERLGKL